MHSTKSLLIDASYLFKRSTFNSSKYYQNNFGKHQGALYSFMTSLRKLIKDYQPIKVILFWDGENGGKGRYLIDSNYKANRENKSWYNKIHLTNKEVSHLNKEKDSELWNRTQIKRYCEELFIRQIEVSQIEADDLIAKYILQHQNTEDIVLFTNDRDFLQLLDYGVTIHMDGLEFPVTKNNSFMFFPYYYKNALAMKIICGDDSDNIEGIKGVGIDTLMKYFPELKDKEFKVRDVLLKAKIINDERIVQKKKPIKALENLINNIERLKINHRLMNLSEPFLNEQAIQELEYLDYALSDKDEKGNERSSKVLYKIMMEDGFLDMYSKYGNFVNYVEPFYIVIANEKAMLKKILNEEK